LPKHIPPIDDDIYSFVQSRAVPLEDDFNSALRRLLGLAATEDGATPQPSEVQPPPEKPSRSGGRAKQRAHTRARKGSILSEDEYELPILEALHQLGDRAPTSEVIDIVGEKLNGKLKETDRQKLGSGEVRWRNRAQFVRLALIKRGDMKAESPRGMWEITEQGVGRIKGDSL
jgi:hypothetical protein